MEIKFKYELMDRVWVLGSDRIRYELIMSRSYKEVVLRGGSQALVIHYGFQDPLLEDKFEETVFSTREELLESL